MQTSEARLMRDPFDEYIRWSSLDVNENANRYIGPGSFFSYLLEDYMKRDLLNLLPPHILRAHRDGLIYVHKLPHSIYIPYCTGHSIARLLEKGLKTPTVISRPARHLDTFVDHVANYLITLQHYFTGAQAFSSVEWYAGPFIRSDSADYKTVKQNIQRLLYNLNYPTRIGLQTPFTNFTIIMDAAKKALEGDYAVYDGKRAEPLGAYEKEAKTFLLALFENYMAGDSVGQPFTFPIPTLMTTAKMIWEDPEIHEAVFKTAAKRGSFYWLNTRVVDPDASYAMCLYESEPIIYKVDGRIFVESIRDFYEEYKDQLESRESDGAEWYTARKGVEVLSFDPETNKVEWRPVKRFLVKKYSKAVRIETVDGRVFLVSPDHPILVKRRDNGKVSLKHAEELLKRKRLRDFRIPVILKEVSSEGYVHLRGDVEITVDEDFGYFLGLYYGDGTLIRNRHDARKMKEDKTRDGYYLVGLQFSINSNEQEIREFIVRYAEKLQCTVREWNDPRWPSVHYIALGCAKLARTLYDNGVSPFSDDKRIPWFIWISPVSVRIAFIKGLLDSDGYWRRETWELHIKNVKLAEEVLLLASISGISAYIRRNKDGSVIVYIPCSRGKEIVGNTDKAIKHRKDGDIAWVALRSVEEVEVDGLFIDVEVDSLHYFVHSHGVITHNCCRISVDMRELEYAYRKNGFSLGSLKRDAEAVKEEYWSKVERQRFGGLWAMPDITGSVNVADVNLPRLALESRGNDDRFWELYDNALALVREAVDWFRNRYVRILREHPGFYYMITEYMPEFPSSHFNTIGLIGLPEAAAILMQEPKLWLDGSRSDWLRAAELMRKMVEYATETARKWMMESGTPWNVEEVPAESASPRMAEIDLKRYPELAEYLPDPGNPVYSTSIAPYYAPEMELPDRIEVESRVQKYFTGGVMMHIFLAEEPEPEALAKLAKRIMDTDIVYWSFTPALTYCPSCNRTYTGLYKACPVCGSENVEVWSRIIGYYRPLKNWNPQRRKEFWTRKHYAF